MRQFIQGSQTAWTELETRASGNCVHFTSEEMPTGSARPMADVGFERDLSSGRATLVVEPMEYFGCSPEIGGWLRTGSRGFASFADLRAWVTNVLKDSFRDGGVAGLTDLEVVRAAINRPGGSCQVIDEEMIYARLSAVVRGQEAAVRSAAGRIARHLAKSEPRRPATLFAVGPTGVGKTRLAETLGDICRALPGPHPCGYLRLDMSEYQEQHRVSQLLGAPQGYVGYQDGAALPDALRANPRSVVLFDEIEKAHPDILRALMNAMDAGRLSSPTSRGGDRIIDCRRAIFIFTSNLESESILHALEERDEFRSPHTVDEVCRRQFRARGIAPELIGRVSCFLVFQPLSAEAKAEVVTIAVETVAREYDLGVQWIEPEAIIAILDQGPGGEFGARPYEYLIDEMLGASFAETRASGTRSVVVCAAPALHCVPALPPEGVQGDVRSIPSGR